MVKKTPTAEDQARIEREALAFLRTLPTLDDLRSLIGDLTPEEQALINSIDWTVPASEEEIRALGPDFQQQLQDILAAQQAMGEVLERWHTNPPAPTDYQTLVARCTPAERALLATIHDDRDPTAEELAAFGPDFGSHLAASLLRKINAFTDNE